MFFTFDVKLVRRHFMMSINPESVNWHSYPESHCCSQCAIFPWYSLDCLDAKNMYSSLWFSWPMQLSAELKTEENNPIKMLE